MGVPNEFATVQRIFNEHPELHTPYNKKGMAYLTRLIAVALNPSGDRNGWGLTAKTSGSNVDGYSVDAIIWGPTNQIVDIWSGSDGPNPQPSWGVGGPPVRSDMFWAVPTLSGTSPPKGPGDGGDGGDDGDDGGSGGTPSPGSATVGEGRMPSMPSGLREEAYQVADQVQKELTDQLSTIPSGNESGEDLPQWQTDAAQLAIAATAAVAADWAITIALRHVKDANGGKPHTEGELSELDDKMNSIFP